jgi:hypothetical protein
MKPELLEEVLGQYSRMLGSTVTGFGLEVTCVVEEVKLEVEGRVTFEEVGMLVEVPGDEAKKRKFAPRATRRTATIATTTMALPMPDLRGIIPTGRAPNRFH